MKHLAFLLPTLMLLGGAGCSGDSRESLAADSMSTMKEMVATLETVKDQASAKAAKPKLTSLAQEMNSLQQRQAKLPAPSEEETKALMTKQGKEREELLQKLMAEIRRTQFDPAIQRELSDIDMKAQK